MNHTHKMVDGELIELTAQEIEAFNNMAQSQYLPMLAFEKRSRRNALLAASDWTRLDDAPVNKALWAAYRQALRDVPQQAGFPLDVQWPVEPMGDV